MQWTVPSLLLFAGFIMDRVSAANQCREERSIKGMALQGFIFKKFSVTAFHVCDISCERELICQSYNYVVGENSCELNNRTKEARPEHFLSDPARVYLRRLRNRGMYKTHKEAFRCRRFYSFLSRFLTTFSGKRLEWGTFLKLQAYRGRDFTGRQEAFRNVSQDWLRKRYANNSNNRS